MTEFQRELILAERAEKRDELIQAREMRVQQRQRQEAEAPKQRPTKERVRPPARQQVPHTPSSASYQGLK